MLVDFSAGGSVNGGSSALFKPASVAATAYTNEGAPLYAHLDRLIRSVTLPAIVDLLKNTGRYYSHSWTRDHIPQRPHAFWDSDCYKVFEACCYFLIKEDIPQIRKDVEEYVDYVKKAQWDDG